MSNNVGVLEEGFNTSDEFKMWTKGLLHDTNLNEVCITFTKADGTERRMRCTARDDLIPADKAPKGTGRAITEATQRVFDLDVGEWRSFRWESVKRVEFDV